MVTTDTQQSDRLLGWMASLADPTRLRLMRLLERHELGVAELCDVLQLPQSTVSRHLKVLGEQDWVVSRRRGTTNLYRTILDELDPAARKLWLLAREQTESWASVLQDQVRLQQHLSDRKRDAEQFFAGAAADWDKLRSETYGTRFTDRALAALLPSDWTVADLGCGTGNLAKQLAPHVRKVIGIDNSAAMLEAARQRLADLSNVDLQTGELEQLPLDRDSVDAAMATLVLTYVVDPELIVAEATRIVRPGGKVAVVDIMKHDQDEFRRQMGQQSMGFDPLELASLLERAGLESVHCSPLPVEPGSKSPTLLLAVGTKP